MKFADKLTPEVLLKTELNVLLHKSLSDPLHVVERSLKLYNLISDNREKLNAAPEYMTFFGYSQVAYIEQVLMTLAKIFDFIDPDHDTQCIQAVRIFIKNKSADLIINNKQLAFRFLLQHGFSKDQIDGVQGKNDQAITEMIRKHYSRLEYQDSDVSKAVQRLRDARNFILAHNDGSIHELETPTFDDINLLTGFAKNFFSVMQMVYMDTIVSEDGVYVGTKESEKIQIPAMNVINDLLTLHESKKK